MSCRTRKTNESGMVGPARSEHRIGTKVPYECLRFQPVVTLPLPSPVEGGDPQTLFPGGRGQGEGGR